MRALGSASFFVAWAQHTTHCRPVVTWRLEVLHAAAAGGGAGAGGGGGGGGSGGGGGGGGGVGSGGWRVVGEGLRGESWEGHELRTLTLPLPPPSP